MKNLSVFLTLILFPLLISCNDDSDDSGGPTGPSGPIVTTVDLIDLYTNDKRGTSTLKRYNGYIEYEIETSNLIPGHVYQIMCAVFNKPQNCVGPCDPEDFINNNTAVEGIAFVMGGRTVNSTTATFEGKLDVSDISRDYVPVSAPANAWGGLQNAKTATIGLNIRSQGPAQAGLSNEQTNTFQQACSFVSWSVIDPSSRVPEEIGECAFIQLSQHDAP